jgi:hypothetical protein
MRDRPSTGKDKKWTHTSTQVCVTLPQGCLALIIVHLDSHFHMSVCHISTRLVFSTNHRRYAARLVLGTQGLEQSYTENTATPDIIFLCYVNPAEFCSSNMCFATLLEGFYKLTWACLMQPACRVLCFSTTSKFKYTASMWVRAF